MKIKYLTKLSALGLAVVFLGACGGGGSSSGTTTTSTRVGTVSGFGSVFINGIEYDTSGASITIDGQSASESDLRVGMVVEVEGSDDGSTGSLTSISNSDELEGLVISNAVDATTQTGTMDIMGQTVNISATTIFESKVAGVTLASDVMAGNIVEVNGYSDSNGNIFATRLEVKAADLASYLASHPEGIELKGIVGTIDSMAMTFPLGGISVNYAAAVIDISGGLQEGQYVEVKSTAGLNGSGELVASRIELENYGEMGHHGDENDEFEIKAMITQDFANGQFMMDGITVIVDSNTELDGVTTAQLLAGVMVEVEGQYDANGDLVADKVELEDAADAEVKDVIQSIVADGTNAGTVTLMDGTVVIVTPQTLMVDDRNNGMMPVQMFNLTHLAIGDYIEVDGHRDTVTGAITAYKLKRDDLGS
jgi:hypothetical protein